MYILIMKQYQNNFIMLKSFNTQNDTLGGFHEGLTGIPAFQDTYYAHILSLNATGENDIYTVSGLDASTLPTQISWEYIGGEDVTNATNVNIYGTSVHSARHYWRGVRAAPRT